MDSRLELLSVALLIALTGCTGGTANDGADSASDAEGVSLTIGASGSAEAEQTGGDDLLQARRRATIRSGQAELTTDEFNRSYDAIKSAAESCDGYASDSSEYVDYRSDSTYHSGQLVVCVPSEDLSALMTDIEVLSEAERVEANSEDMAGQLVDIEARLSNLRAQYGRLCNPYESTSTTEDVLAAEERLTDI